MTRAIRIVFAKEMLENLRDRRVIISAFLFGVLLAPVIFGLTTTLASKRAVGKPGQAVATVRFRGQARTESGAFSAKRTACRSRRSRDAPMQAISEVRAGVEDLVLLIDAEYGRS